MTIKWPTIRSSLRRGKITTVRTLLYGIRMCGLFVEAIKNSAKKFLPGGAVAVL